MITASVVLYNTKPQYILDLLDSFKFYKKNYQLFIIDNSPTDKLKNMFNEQVNYFHCPENKGFGHGHNIAINLAININSNYHLIINPDISFKEDIITPMIELLLKDKNIGIIMPNILNSDGSIQFLPKLLPSPLSLVIRKIGFSQYFFKKFLIKYEFRKFLSNKIYNVPIISGCFSILNIEAIKNVGTFDEQFFLYFEDWDLSRRLNSKYKNIFFPKVTVYHSYASEANHKFKFLLIYIKSAIIYFNKWGWFFDSERKKINKKTLLQIEN